MKNNIKILRVQNDFTQEQLANRVSVSRQTINAVEAGKYNPSTVLALKIANVLKTPVEDIFTLEEED